MKLKFYVLSALLLALVACEKKESAPAEVNLTTEDDRFSYGLGMVIGERVLKEYGEVDYDLVLAGMKAQHKGETTLITVDEAGNAVNARMEKLFAERTAANRKRGEDYLTSNKAKEGVQVTESGLQYSVITDAEGPKPKPTDTVTVHYRGTLIDGTEFDSSYSRGAPTSFQLNQVIPGWTEGVQLMSVGAKYQFVIPHDLAYGERGAGGQIGPFETLIFEVELIEINS
ncbi:MAG: FKBP-type peptidyl-prolyl cis-trans isomerase [Gammaproteobacteria bacterium]|nr:MAG: FKBP-type peptidyl-prolyl cis-trans isomerase [Gammaproteobacteria bacterium]UCH39911.1 MAG: FKBP-type peptidyl-prolyl cis-trans isomerase [Gammaproteobacteria bacterium]